MAEEQKDKQEEGGCCEKGSCGSGGCGCGGNCRCGSAIKYLVGFLLGLLLAGAGFCLYSAGRCAGSRCVGKMAMSCPVQTAPATPTPPAPTK